MSPRVPQGWPGPKAIAQGRNVEMGKPEGGCQDGITSSCSQSGIKSPPFAGGVAEDSDTQPLEKLKFVELLPTLQGQGNKTFIGKVDI